MRVNKSKTFEDDEQTYDGHLLGLSGVKYHIIIRLTNFIKRLN